MDEEKIREIVYRNYKEGFHCAETIANTIHELFPDQSKLLSKATSGFCGGIGECKQDACGALTGGVVALGSIFGRDTGGKDISKLVNLSAQLRQQFINEFTTTVCKNVIENIENRPEYDGCSDVTAKTSWLLYNLLQKEF